MARTKISFVYKQLASGVVRGRRREARGQGFERWWPWSAHFLREKRALHGHRRSKPRPPASRLQSLTTPPASCFCPNEIFVLAILCSSDFEMSIWDPKRIQMKKLSTTKFYNFSRSTTFILVFTLSEVVYQVWISNFRNSNVVFHDKMISNEKVVNYKVS